MTCLLLPMPGNEALAAALAARLPAEIGVLTTRQFPDGETYLRLPEAIDGNDVNIICTLADPDPKFLRLAFTAATARELGARRVNLIAPYFAYMRQDKRFHPGEAVSARYFGQLLSGLFDRVVTIDPHLHRIARFQSIVSMPATVLQAAPLLGAWVKANVVHPVLVGPDSESEQWVAAVAGHAGAPYFILAKQRLGDRQVTIDDADLAGWRGHAPVLVDDMIASGHTMLAAAALLAAQGLAKPACLTVHAIFAGDAHARLAAVTTQVVSTDTIPHVSNRISVAPLLADAIAGAPTSNP